MDRNHLINHGAGHPGIIRVPGRQPAFPAVAYLRGWEAHRGLGHVLQGQLHECLLPGLLQVVAGSDDCFQDLEQPELVPGGDLWVAEWAEAQGQIGFSHMGSGHQ